MRKAPLSRWLPGVSRGSMAVLLLAAPIAAQAQGFAGTASVFHGTATIITPANGTQTVNIPASSPVTTINWTPTDTATSANAIDFLPAGNSVSYIGAGGASVPYTVLNRIIPTDQTRTIAFNGTVTSTANTRVWFYSPGGLLIGATASFNVGGLVLTAADPVTDANNNFMTSFDQFGLAAAPGSTSAITIQPGASIKALGSKQSNYVVAFAPQINQGGTISVAGAVALVAAESASFAVDKQGLFTISVSSGTTVSANTFVHGGSTGGPNAASTGAQRVYMVAVPKNNAIAMAIAAGGTVGFAAANAASVDGNEIVLSAGSNIADTGSGNPVVAGRAGSGTASLTAAGNFTSASYAVSTDTATITDPATSIGFASDLTVIAPQATVNAQFGTISVGGKLIVSAGDMLTGQGGSALVENTGGSIAVTGDALVSANGSWGVGPLNNGSTATRGGTAQVSAVGGTIMVGGSLMVEANADATGADAAFVSQGNDFGLTAIAGKAQVIADGGRISVASANGITVAADAHGGTPTFNSGSGGNATGGTALIATRGSNASIATNTGLSMVTSKFTNGVEANAIGGDASGPFSAQGGSATAGTATLEVTGASQSIALDRSARVLVDALAIAGVGVGNGGGKATGGTARLSASGGTLAITNSALDMSASAGGGADQFANGGDAIGGTVRLAASAGGSIDAAVATAMSAAATGGTGSGNGGNALGGNILIALGNNAINFAAKGITTALDASYTAGTSSGNGSSGTADSAGGVLLTDLGTASLAGAVTIANNTPFYVQAGGSINVTGSITGTGLGAYLHLWADDLGSGTGTVMLANGALNLPGNQIDIYYNPASLGTPTDFSSGIAAGNSSGYQLVDTIDQLQLVGSYLSQNFALGRNIDASATQGWNGGAGFVPIGDGATRFTGNFDGLNHAVNNLYVNTPSSSDVGLFGQVANQNGINGIVNNVIRNVGLTNVAISGFSHVGGLVGCINCTNGSGHTSVINSYVTGGVITGNKAVGGLAGLVDHNIGGVFTNDHTDVAVNGVGSSVSDVGGLAGAILSGLVSDVFTTGPVTATGNALQVGGLVGSSDVDLSKAYATGAVTAGANAAQIGGLIGLENGGSLAQLYATGSVTVGAGSDSIGGLVGANVAPINEAWASGQVTAPLSTSAAGLVGHNSGAITNSYWDSFSTGQISGVGTNSGTVTNLNPVTSDPNASGAYAFDQSSYSNFAAADWVYDNALTRPVGAWEVPTPRFGVATIATAHQIQLIDLNLGGDYTITQNIDMRGTAGTSDIWGPGGFMPVGLVEVNSPFTGNLEGAGHVLSNLTIATTFGYGSTGLIQQNSGTISDLGLDQVTISGINTTHVGAIAGINSGTITDSFATGTIKLTQFAAQYAVAGGLVGLNASGSSSTSAGSITQSYASVAVSGGQAAGGLVGDNEGVISGSFANGAVSATFAGGLVGESFGQIGPSIASSYWDTQLSGQTLGCGSGSCSGATGLTTAQTLQSASFTGFAIDTQGGKGLPWRQYEGQTTPLLEAFLTPIIVQPGSLTVQYNATVPNVGVTSYGAQPSLTFGTAQVAGLTQNAGTALLTYTGGLYSSQLGYDFVPSTTPGTLVITPAPLTLSAVSDTRGYDATTNSTGVPQVVGLYGPDTVGSLTQSFASPNAMGTNGSTLVVNGGYVVNDGNNGANYAVTLQNAPGTITPAALAVTYTANPASSIYGNAIAGLTGTVGAQGLQGEDTLASVVSGTASFATTATGLSNVGSYAITGSGLSANSGNYSFSFVQDPGNANALTIVARALTLTADPLSRVYGSANPTSDTASASPATANSGLVNGDAVASEAVTSPASASSGVGQYALDGSAAQFSAGLASNYAITYATNTTGLAITPAALTLLYTAAPANSTYGNAPSGLTGSISLTGFVNGDTAASVTSGNALWTSPATAASNVGSYAINGSGVGLASANYSLITGQAPGNATALTITPRPITVTADPQQRQVGTANPLFTYVVTSSTEGVTPGLVNGDQLSGLLTSAATITSPPGKYDILQGTLAATANYRLSYVGNVLTVVYDTSPLSTIGDVISANLPHQTDGSPQERRKQQEAALEAVYAALGLHAPQIVQSMINDQLVTTPPPVSEPVTSNGNASLWKSGAP